MHECLKEFLHHDLFKYSEKKAASLINEESNSPLGLRSLTLWFDAIGAMAFPILHEYLKESLHAGCKHDLIHGSTVQTGKDRITN